MDLAEIRDRIMRKTHVQNVDELDADINLVQRQYIQPLARVINYLEHVTEDQDDEVDLPEDYYKLHWARDITDTRRGMDIPMISDSKGDRKGIRIANPKMQFLGIMPDRRIQVAYRKLLSDLGPGGGVTEPEIPELWHDLYWLGVLAIQQPEGFFELFQDRLTAFKVEQENQAHPHGQTLQPRGWW